MFFFVKHCQERQTVGLFFNIKISWIISTSGKLNVQLGKGLQEKLFKFKGFYVQPRTIRKYPNNTASHVLGYIGEVTDKTIEKNPYYRQGDYIGTSGIEQSYEEELRGIRGVRIVMVDVFNREKGS